MCLLNIKERFENYSLKEQVLLYFSVLLFSILVFILYGNWQKSLYIIKSKDTVTLAKEVVAKKEKLSDVELLKYFNKNIELFNITLQEINISQKRTTLKAIGRYSPIINFLRVLSHNFKIEQFSIENNVGKVFISLELNTSRFFKSGQKNLISKKFVNPFLYEIADKTKKSSPFIINAIIDTEVLINNRWYKKDEIINNYKILEIKKDALILMDLEHNSKIFRSVSDE